MSLDFLNKPSSRGASADAFGRLRISDPQTIFDYQSEYDAGPLIWQDEIAGSATASHSAANSSVDLTVTTSSGDRVTRQTRQYHRYQPGKSQLVLMTFVMNDGQENTEQRVGYFDDNNGIFLELSGTTIRIVQRSSTSGSVVDTAVEQSDWNIDQLPALDLSRANILAIDMEWLGVGSVRVGFVIDGQFYYAHQFNNANNLSTVYMTTANLPARYEIENVGVAAASATLRAICTSVISEGGFEDNRGIPFCSSTGGTLIGVNTTARTPIISLRPKATFNSITNRGQLLIYNVEGYVESTGALFEVIYDGTLTGAFFASVDDDSITESDTSATAVTGGQAIFAFYVAAGGQISNSSTQSILSRLPLSLEKDGTNPKNISLVATRIGGSGTSNVAGAWFWQELR